MKNKLGGKIIKKFVGLGAKTDEQVHALKSLNLFNKTEQLKQTKSIFPQIR